MRFNGSFELSIEFSPVFFSPKVTQVLLSFNSNFLSGEQNIFRLFTGIEKSYVFFFGSGLVSCPNDNPVAISDFVIVATVLIDGNR